VVLGSAKRLSHGLSQKVKSPNVSNTGSRISEMKVLRCLASAGFLLLLCEASGAVMSGGRKTFELATKDGDVLCATSTVSQTTSVNDLQLTTADRLPPQVVCARQCTSQGPCHSFNYRSDTNSCHFYHYAPTTYQPQPNCQYFQVRRKCRVI